MATAVQKLTGDVNRVKVIQMRIAGKTNEQIAAELGLTESGVRYHARTWLESQQPSAEQTEELRQVQAAQIDALTAKLWPHVMRPLRDEDGCVIHGADGNPIETPDVQVVDRLAKLMDRKARLMGLDLQLGVTVNVLTRESLADVLYADEPVIEGVAVEIEAGGES